VSLDGRPRPAVERDSAPWWAALARHELVLQRCAACATWRWPPREMCNRCGALSWAWEPASGWGTIASWIVNRHSFSDAFASPYVVVAVRVAEQDDIVMFGSWAGAADGSDLHAGLAVVAGFDDVSVAEGDDPLALLRWAPAPGDAAPPGGS